MLRVVYFWVALQLFQGPLARWVAPSRAEACADLVADATYGHGGGFAELAATAATVAGESGCNPAARSADGEDCGIVQQRGPARHGRSCAALMADPWLALDLWESDIAKYAVECGSLRAGLGVLYGGKCGARAPLVRFRCALAGC